MNNFLVKKIGYLEKWFFEKKKIISLFFNSEKKILNAQMGDIYWAKLGVNIGREIDKMRPVLVFQGKNWFLKNSDMVFVIPITSTIKKGKYKVLIEDNDSIDNSVSGMLLLQQFRSILKFRLGRKITSIKLYKLEEVQSKFNKLLYKNTPLSPKRKGDNSV